MRVALDDRYKDMSSELKKLGYTVVGSEFKRQVEAVLYHSNFDDGFIENINHTPLISGTNTTGVLLIDIKNKNARDIDAILKSRLYTPLF